MGIKQTNLERDNLPKNSKLIKTKYFMQPDHSQKYSMQIVGVIVMALSENFKLRKLGNYSLVLQYLHYNNLCS